MSEKQPGAEQNENLKENVEVFGKEALSKEDLASMHEKVMNLMNESDPEKKAQSTYDAAENLISLKQAGIKVGITEKFATKMKNALPQIADKNPAALARYLNVLKYLGAVDKDSIDPKYTQKLEDHIKERISAAPDDFKDETGKHIKGLAELCINMKGIGMETPYGAKRLLKNRLAYAIEGQDTDALELSKLMVQVQHIEGGKSMGQYVDTAHANLSKRVESDLSSCKEKGHWKEYAKLRAVYEMYKKEDGERALINTASLLDDKTQQNLVDHTKVIADKGDINAVGSYVSHLRRIEETEKLKREKTAGNTEIHEEDKPQNKDKSENDFSAEDRSNEKAELSIKERIEVQYVELVKAKDYRIDKKMADILERYDNDSVSAVSGGHRLNKIRHERKQSELRDTIKAIENSLDDGPMLKELAASIKKEVFEGQSLFTDDTSLQTPLMQLIKEHGAKLSEEELQDVYQALSLVILHAGHQFLSFKQNLKQINEIIGAMEDLLKFNKDFKLSRLYEHFFDIEGDLVYGIAIERIREGINEEDREKYPKHAERKEDLQQLLYRLCKVNALNREKPYFSGFDVDEFESQNEVNEDTVEEEIKSPKNERVEVLYKILADAAESDIDTEVKELVEESSSSEDAISVLQDFFQYAARDHVRSQLEADASSVDYKELQSSVIKLINEQGSQLKGEELKNVERDLNLVMLHAWDRFLDFDNNIEQLNEIIEAQEKLLEINSDFTLDIDNFVELKKSVVTGLVSDKIWQGLTQENKLNYPRYAERREDLKKLLDGLHKIEARVQANLEFADEVKDVDTNKESPVNIENESREFKELIKEGAERGRIMVYSSWSGQAAGKRLQSDGGYQIAADSRLKKERGAYAQELTESVFEEDWRWSYGHDASTLKEIPELIRIKEPLYPYGPKKGSGLSLSEYTGKAEDENEPVLEIIYDIRHTDDRMFAEYSDRSNNMTVGMVLPAKIARQIYKEIEKDPSKIRQLLGEFDKRVVKAAEESQENSGNKYDTRFLEQFNMPTKECDIFVYPEEGDDAMLKNDRGLSTGPNPKYIKRVEFKNNFE